LGIVQILLIIFKKNPKLKTINKKE